MRASIKSVLILVSDSQKVSAEIMVPKNPKAIFVFAHGAGAGMNHTFMKELATALAEFQIATCRYNFLFMENGKKRPDSPALAYEVVSSAIKYAHQKFPNLPLFAGGKSFGGRMTSQFLAVNKVEFVSGLILVGFPLHPAKKHSIDRAMHVSGITLPILFLQGTKDMLADWKLIKRVCKKLKTATLVKIDGADHSFKIPKKSAIPFLAESINHWIDSEIGR